MRTSNIDSADAVKRIRALSGLSQAKFASFYGIPRRTVEAWEMGDRIPPDYVLSLLERAVREDFPK